MAYIDKQTDARLEIDAIKTKDATDPTTRSPVPTIDTSSEKPVAPLPMDFYTALRRTMSGKKISRLEWGTGYYGVLRDRDNETLGRLCIHKPDGKLHEWIISAGDMLAVDWYVL